MSTPNDILTRKFKSSDLDMVKELIYKTIDVCYADVYPEEAVQFFKDWHCDENILKGAMEGYTIVLEINGQIIGTGSLVGDEIVRVFVEPRWQRCGFGKTIMRHLEEKALSLGTKVVKLDASLPSKKFYDSMEYQTLEQTFIPMENDKRLDYYKMDKALAK